MSSRLMTRQTTVWHQLDIERPGLGAPMFLGQNRSPDAHPSTAVRLRCQSYAAITVFQDLVETEVSTLAGLRMWLLITFSDSGGSEAPIFLADNSHAWAKELMRPRVIDPPGGGNDYLLWFDHETLVTDTKRTSSDGLLMPVVEAWLWLEDQYNVIFPANPLTTRWESAGTMDVWWDHTVL